jgi:tetratricopeptide (TPR) repeat protein
LKPVGPEKRRAELLVCLRLIGLLILAIAVPADVWPQTVRAELVPDLPQLDTTSFQPAIRHQVQQAIEAARRNLNDAEATGELAMVLDAYEQYDSAEICYERAHRLDSASFRWLYYLGWVQATQGKHPDAVLTLREALRNTPDYVPAQLKLAESLFAIGNWQESRDIYQAIGTAHPDGAEAYYGLGRVLAAIGDVNGSTQAYRKACELFPAYGAAHYGLALNYRQAGRETESREQFSLYEANKTAVPASDDSLRQAVSTRNLGSVAHIRRGADLAQAGRLDEAIAEHIEALRVDPEAVQAHINLISLYGRLGRYEEAAGHYRAALALDGRQADTHYNYGILLLKQGKHQEAENAFQQALQINPDYVEAHNNLGSIYEQQGRLKEAFQQFAQAVDSRPADRVAHFHMGRILANEARYDEAIQHLLKTLGPEDEDTPRYVYALGATYGRAGNVGDALKYIRTARELAAARGQAQLVASIDRDLRALERAAPTAGEK